MNSRVVSDYFTKGEMNMSVYSQEATLMTGETISLQTYAGQVILIVNTATQCGFTPQLKELETVYETYKEKGFTILAFPCNQFGNQEPGTNEEVQTVCERDHGITFPLFEKINVKGPDAHPLFTFLTEEKKGRATKEIKWNFTKFLIDRNGQVVKRYAPITKPEKISNDIETYL